MLCWLWLCSAHSGLLLHASVTVPWSRICTSNRVRGRHSHPRTGHASICVDTIISNSRFGYPLAPINLNGQEEVDFVALFVCLLFFYLNLIVCSIYVLFCQSRNKLAHYFVTIIDGFLVCYLIRILSVMVYKASPLGL